MRWFFLALVAALGLILVRVYVKLRAARSSRRESWDEQIVGRLRSQGYAPFNDYRVDFFLALPDDAACQAARMRSEEHTSELQSRLHLVCRLLLEKKIINQSIVLLPQWIIVPHHSKRLFKLSVIFLEIRFLMKHS